MNFIDLDDMSTKPVFALLYGGSGTGKTDFCATCAELGRVLFIDIDKGSKTLQHSVRLSKESWTNNITACSFDKFGDLDAAYKVVAKNDPAAWSKILGVTIEKPFDWIIWDSWTELQWHMHLELRKNNQLAARADTIEFRKNLQIQHWGALTDLNKLAVESLRDCQSVNQIFVCLETTKEDDNTKQIVYGPSIHGKLVAEFPGYFDDVLYSYTDLGGKYRCTTKPKSRYIAKTRLGAGQDVENPYARNFFGKAPRFSE